MFYVINAREFTLDAVIFLLIVVLGNAVGGLFIPICFKAISKLSPETK